MGWCERCGSYFVLSTGKPIKRSARSQGTFTGEIIDTVCPSCLIPGESLGG